MKYKLILDKEAEEEIIAVVHAPSPLTVPDGDEPKARTSWAVFPLVDEGINCGEFQPRTKEDR